MKPNFVSLGILLSLFLSACGDSDESTKGAEYKVSGSDTAASVTYSGKGESTEQKSDVALPWEFSFKPEKGDFLYISAQNNGKAGSVTVQIYVDGKKYKEATSEGAYVIATVSGTY
ncbi:MAG: hypothetical protein HQM12_02475 [SAR324 cluster bacterium]|nr:hypothetical protein [SAR324 cluster bacterium]